MRRILHPLLFSLLLAVPLAAQNQKLDIPVPIQAEAEAKAGDKVDEKEAAGSGENESVPAKEKVKEPIEAQISAHILKLAEAERDNRMSFMRIVIDDIVRLCELDGAQREKLELAAKGAAERSMKEWHEQAERYFRTRLDSTDPDAAKEMLDGMGSVNFGGNRSEEEGESLELWKDSLTAVLTEEQVKRYEAVLGQRKADRIDAFARMSLSTIDDHLRLTPDQKAKIGGIVQASATDYLEDVQRYWGDYFERGMLMSLANSAEEEALKSILTEQQFDRLREATSNFDHFWDQKRRLKRAKEKATNRGKDGGKEADPEEGRDQPKAEAIVNPDKAQAAVIGGAAGGVIRIQGGNGIIIKGGAGAANIRIEEAAPAPAKGAEPRGLIKSAE